MSKSYTEINYSIRPAKNIERKMMAETFKRLYHFEDLNDYQYIGMGSPFFCDFKLFHNELGITDMFCIEKEENDKDRFEFNKPFDCISIKYCEALKALSLLDWSQRKIIWLDYDGKFDSGILQAIDQCVSNVASGSIIAISSNVAFQKEEAIVKYDEYGNKAVTIKAPPLDALIERVGREKIPLRVKDEDLTGWGGAKVCREISSNIVENALFIRNENVPEKQKMHASQIFNFKYFDGAKMSTYGWIIYSETEKDLYEKCHFEKLNFIKEEEKEEFIQIPSLTLNELTELNKQLPNDLNNIKFPIIPKSDIKKYHNNYRYFPNFIDAGLF